MTNPGNAVGTNAAYGGRTSVNAFNDGIAAYTRGILSGWACEPDTGMTVALGGDGNIRDVAIAEDNAGNKTTINNISGSPINVTLSAAPGANSRIDAIVAYVDSPAQGTSTVADNPSACGLIAVTGVAAADPSEPSDNAIRTAITADGASGPTAYYVVLATVLVVNGTTDIVSDDITIKPSSTEIGSFKKWSPDYTNTSATNLWSGTNSATMTENGFVVVTASGYRVNQSTDISVTINSKTVLRATSEARNPNNATTASVSGVFQVSVGDIIEYVPNSASTNFRTCYFIPGKWI